MQMNLSGIAFVLMLCAMPAAGCVMDAEQGDDVSEAEAQGELDSEAEEVGSAQQAIVTTGFTSHFRTWLANNGYEPQYNLARDDLAGGSFGGKASAADTVIRQPVIFIHGNSDKAVGTGEALQTGWNASLDYFASQGYKTSELYATTWGPASAAMSPFQYHSKTNVMKVRKLIEAVKAYTGMAKVDVVAHSMGVTLARRAILGGWATDALEGGDYYIGDPLKTSIDTFVGIAGANLGLTSCYLSGPGTPTCGNTNGLYPGALFLGSVVGRSAVLDALKATSKYEGTYRYSIFSTADEVIGYGGVVYGEYTSRIPGQTGEKKYTGYPYGHYNSKDLTASVQVSMVKSHVVP